MPPRCAMHLGGKEGQPARCWRKTWLETGPPLGPALCDTAAAYVHHHRLVYTTTKQCSMCFYSESVRLQVTSPSFRPSWCDVILHGTGSLTRPVTGLTDYRVQSSVHDLHPGRGMVRQGAATKVRSHLGGGRAWRRGQDKKAELHIGPYFGQPRQSRARTHRHDRASRYSSRAL